MRTLILALFCEARGLTLTTLTTPISITPINFQLRKWRPGAELVERVREFLRGQVSDSQAEEMTPELWEAYLAQSDFENPEPEVTTTTRARLARGSAAPDETISTKTRISLEEIIAADEKAIIDHYLDFAQELMGDGEDGDKK